MTDYSVLMSVYSGTQADELRQAADSMLGQTLAPEQFVIVYDGPVDGAVDRLVQSYARQNSRCFTLVRLSENKGLAYALNEGLKACRNELVARMDSDDISLPRRCAEQVKRFEQNAELALCGTGTAKFEGGPEHLLKEAKRFPESMEEIRKTARRSSPFSHPAVMYKKSVVQAAGGYDPSLRRSQDLDLFTRIVQSGYLCSNIRDLLVLIRAGEDHFKRSRSRETCRNRILIQKRILRRGGCSRLDYLYVRCAMLAARFAPAGLYRFLHRRAVSK